MMHCYNQVILTINQETDAKIVSCFMVVKLYVMLPLYVELVSQARAHHSHAKPMSWHFYTPV